jgi:copper resistance protein B
MTKLLAFLSLLGAAGGVAAHGTDDPLLFGVTVEQLEWREGDVLGLEGRAWLGRDLRKFWVKFDAEYIENHLDEAELQALYSVAVAPYWDVQLGVRQDVRPQPSKTWGVLALHGLAPYFFATDLSLFVGEGGAVAASLTAEYELRLTQTLILAPEITLDLYGQNDRETATGSGLAQLAMGLRLRYEIRPEIAPYIGVQRWHKHGNSAAWARDAGEATADTVAVAGLRFWF